MSEELLIKQREKRARTGNAATKKYEKTKNGFLMRLYRNMQSRIAGVQRLKHHLYKGKYILPRDKFYDWANQSQQFHDLFLLWELSGHERRLTPSVDRINPELGYDLSNMRWVTHSENSKCARRGKSLY